MGESVADALSQKQPLFDLLLYCGEAGFAFEAVTRDNGLGLLRHRAALLDLIRGATQFATIWGRLHRHRPSCCSG